MTTPHPSDSRRPPRSRRSRASSPLEEVPRLGRKHVIAITAIAGVTALTVAVLPYFDSSRSVPPEQLVELYRAHSCQCVYALQRSLETQGFVVLVRNAGALAYIRHSLKTPQGMHGCHVGKYLGYFVEGHVPASAMRLLDQKRPKALGITTRRSVISQAEHENGDADARSGVLLVERSGRMSQW